MEYFRDRIFQYNLALYEGLHNLLKAKYEPLIKYPEQNYNITKINPKEICVLNVGFVTQVHYLEKVM